MLISYIHVLLNCSQKVLKNKVLHNYNLTVTDQSLDLYQKELKRILVSYKDWNIEKLPQHWKRWENIYNGKVVS